MSDRPPRGPWPAERYPSPAEFVDWFVGLEREDQLLVAAGVVNDSERVMRCLVENHTDRLRQLEALRYAASVEDYQARPNPQEDTDA